MSQRLKANAAALAAHVGKAAPMPPPDDATASGASTETPLVRFSRELAQRFPDTLVQRFVMPSTIMQCREVFIREVTSADETEAAIYADQTASKIEKESVRLMNDAENREIVRLAIVGFGDNKSGAMAYEHVNHDGIPLERINGWPQKAWAALRHYFSQINGVPMSEIREGIEGAQTVGAFAPPTSATQPANGDGK